MSFDSGICVKTTSEPGKQKVFVNICQSNLVPPPPEISKEELLDLLQLEDPSGYRVPMSLGEAHTEVDNSQSFEIYEHTFIGFFFSRFFFLPLCKSLQSIQIISNRIHCEHKTGFCKNADKCQEKATRTRTSELYLGLSSDTWVSVVGQLLFYMNFEQDWLIVNTATTSFIDKAHPCLTSLSLLLFLLPLLKIFFFLFQLSCSGFEIYLALFLITKTGH